MIGTTDSAIGAGLGRGMRVSTTGRDSGLRSGETGSAALAGAMAVAASADREDIGFTREATVLLLCTEGATDPLNYERIVGHPPT